MSESSGGSAGGGSGDSDSDSDDENAQFLASRTFSLARAAYLRSYQPRTVEAAGAAAGAAKFSSAAAAAPPPPELPPPPTSDLPSPSLTSGVPLVAGVKRSREALPPEIPPFVDLAAVPTRPLRIGFICGRDDGDHVRAAGIPEAFWQRDSDSEEEKEEHQELDQEPQQEPMQDEGQQQQPQRRSKKPEAREEVCSDVAIWWYVKTHYPSVEADMILPGPGLTAERLQSNDINLLLGYDAVSAHIIEFDDSYGPGCRGSCLPGSGAQVAALLSATTSKVWPPAALQDLTNRKSSYLLAAAANGIRIAPTEVHRPLVTHDAAAIAAAVLTRVAVRGWRQFIVKPVPSSWCDASANSPQR